MENKNIFLKKGEVRYTCLEFTAISAQSLNIYRKNKISYNDNNSNNNRHDDKRTTRIASVTIKGCQYLNSFIQNKEYLCVSLKSWQVNMT